MLSYREALQRINIQPGTEVRYLERFRIRPKSLRTMILWTLSPGGWTQVEDIFLDEVWTEEVQGVTYIPGRWVFASNGSQPVTISTRDGAIGGAIFGGLLGGPVGAAVGAGLGAATGGTEITVGGNPRALYFFDEATSLLDGDLDLTVLFDQIVPSSDVTLHHIGNLDFFEDKIFVAHWNDAGGHLIVLDTGGSYLGTIPLQQPPNDAGEKFEMLAVLPDGRFLTTRSSKPSTLFVHNADGSFANLQFGLDAEVTTYQGGCCSPAGKVYIATNMEADGHQLIAIASLLNGHVFDYIQVPAFGGKDELEGVCFARAGWPDGRRAEIHVVLLENHTAARDNIFFKSFAADAPENV